MHRSSLAILVLSACASGPVTIMPPRVPQGGRAVSIAVTFNNPKRLVVATETGGLFRTYDGGISWQHLNGLPNFNTVDVAIASLAPSVILATTRSEFRIPNDGGIWRSTDDGASWSQPAGSLPPPGLNCPSRPSAYAISHLPGSRTFYVGTDCGISVSTNDGASWSHVQPILNVANSDSLANQVQSLLVLHRTFGVAAGSSLLAHLDSTGTWVRADTNPNINSRATVTHAFAAPWWTGSHPIVFHATNKQQLFLSSDGGAGWTQVAAPSAQIREAFVHSARQLAGDESKFVLWYGDGMVLHRQTFAVSDGSGSGSWANLHSDHQDPSDVGLDQEQREPIMLATDGGVHVTTDHGEHWKLTGSGYGGFTALQIMEITGQVVTGSKPHQDLYYGTQDNDLKASSDGGSTWPGSICCEGAFLRVMPTSEDHEGTRVTMRRCGGCDHPQSGAHFEHVILWPDAPAGGVNGKSQTPFLIVGDGYLQAVENDATPQHTFDFFLTLSAGAAWSKSFSLAKPPVGEIRFAGSLANPTAYVGVQVSELPNRFGLFRVRNLAGQAVVASVADGFSMAPGLLVVPEARHVVVGVDPGDPNHLIAPDVASDEMKFSADGGTTWQPLPQLTAAVTDTGKFLFRRQEKSLASVIAWDPYNRCHILVGTIQNGVIRSTDGGGTWKRIEGSRAITFVSSFYFPPTGDIWVSSHGRGLWVLRLDRQEGAAKCGFAGR